MERICGEVQEQSILVNDKRRQVHGPGHNADPMSSAHPHPYGSGSAGRLVHLSIRLSSLVAGLVGCILTIGLMATIALPFGVVAVLLAVVVTFLFRFTRKTPGFFTIGGFALFFFSAAAWLGLLHG